jgi:hypothetical protein
MAELCCCAEPGDYCACVDTLFNMPGVHVLDVTCAPPQWQTASWSAVDGGVAAGRDRLSRSSLSSSALTATGRLEPDIDRAAISGQGCLVAC